MVAITKDSLIAATIAKYMTLRHVDLDALAIAARMSDRTFHRKRKNPSSFTVNELRQVYDRLSVPKEERVGL